MQKFILTIVSLSLMSILLCLTIAQNREKEAKRTKCENMHGSLVVSYGATSYICYIQTGDTTKMIPL